MKKSLILLLLTSFAALSALQAQDDPEKDVKKGDRLLGSYRVDPTANADKLDEAKVLIDGAIASGALENDAGAWITYGQLYLAILNKEVNESAVNPEYTFMNKEAPSKIVKGFTKGYELAEKNRQKKDALEGLTAILNNISYMSATLLQKEEFESAFNGYEALIEGNKFVVEQGEPGLYETEEAFQEQYYWTALAAFSAGKYDEASEYFQFLIDADYDRPDIYAGQFEVLKASGDQEGADAILAEGVKRYPGDKGLMFAEINSALAKGDLDILVGKLQAAMESEPENITIPTTLGNVYDQLYQKAIQEEEYDKANEYYTNAKKYFSKALEMDPGYFDALYMMGAVEYNKAAQLAQELNALADDYSKEGTAKYDAKKADLEAQFAVALPYFKKAEEVNPDDINTLIALREIYARQDKLDLSEEYKAKIESLSQE